MQHNFPFYLFASLILFCPFSILFLGFFPESRLNKRPFYFAVLGSRMAFLAFISSLLSVFFLIRTGPLLYYFTLNGRSFELLYFDALSALILVLICFLLSIILRFSSRYLDGDKHHGRFTKWLCLTGGSVLFIVISGNLIELSMAWVSTSLCLHQLLQFYPERPGALLAAKKKFIISRLGDICLLGVLILVYREFHSWDFEPIFRTVGSLNGQQRDIFIQHINPICLLLVGGAMMKSAQFPFHSWLPDTMETPTPVSALMHAGIINAGGFLIIRMGSMVSLSHAAMATLAFFGALTALLGSLVMLTHSSIKRVLAFSTIAQMGFMMLECGLGAFSLALLHLLSHSLYKAYEFLSSGTIKSSGKSFLSPMDSSPKKVFPFLFSFFSSFLLVYGISSILKISSFNNPPNLVLTIFFSLSIGFFLWNLWSRKWSLFFVIIGLAGSMGISLAYFTLHKLFQEKILVSLSNNYQSYSPLEYVLVGFLVLLFVVVLLIQVELPSRMRSTFLGSLYVHARNGFYFNTLFNQWVSAIWPSERK